MSTFLDSNVLDYLLDSGRQEKTARRLASDQPHISVQVLNEFIAVCKKCGKDRETAYQLADAIANASTVHEITLSTYRLAQALATRYQLSQRPLHNCNQTVLDPSKKELANEGVEADARKFWQLRNERAHTSGQRTDESAHSD